MFFRQPHQQTKVNNSLSYIADLISGIVQGSNIGPVFFLMYNLSYLLDKIPYLL